MAALFCALSKSTGLMLSVLLIVFWGVALQVQSDISVGSGRMGGGFSCHRRHAVSFLLDSVRVSGLSGADV